MITRICEKITLFLQLTSRCHLFNFQSRKCLRTMIRLNFDRIHHKVSYLPSLTWPNTWISPQSPSRARLQVCHHKTSLGSWGDSVRESRILCWPRMTWQGKWDGRTAATPSITSVLFVNSTMSPTWTDISLGDPYSRRYSALCRWTPVYTAATPNLSQYQNPSPPSDLAHLLLVRAPYVNHKDQAKDTLSSWFWRFTALLQWRAGLINVFSNPKKCI